MDNYGIQDKSIYIMINFNILVRKVEEKIRKNKQHKNESTESQKRSKGLEVVCSTFSLHCKERVKNEKVKKRKPIK